MKRSTRLALVLLASTLVPLTARADYTFKCKSVTFSDQLAAVLRFDGNGGDGRIEVDYWNGYPPIGLVYADVKKTVKKGKNQIFTTEADAHSGYTAQFTLPQGYIDQDSVLLTLKIQGWGNGRTYQLNCARF